jgi:hypothetical protein
MHRSVLKEIRRTLQVMKRIGRSVDLQPGTTPEKLRSIEAAIGFQFTEDLRDFYQFTNGLDKHFFEGSDVVPWFATGDPYVADYPLTFHSPEEAFSWWSSYKDQPWWEGNQWGEPDPRIQPLLWHRGYLIQTPRKMESSGRSLSTCTIRISCIGDLTVLLSSFDTRTLCLNNSWRKIPSVCVGGMVASTSN